MAKKTPSEKKTGARKPSRRHVATARLTEELAALRGITADVLENVRLELEAALADLERQIENQGKGREKILVRDLEAALDRIHALRVRPAKGRPKDVRRLADLLADLDRLLSERG